REVGVRRRARQFFEEAREVEGREVRGVGDLFEREVALHVRVHQLDGEAYAPVNESGAREFETLGAAQVRVAAEQVYERVLDERADDQLLTGGLFEQLLGEVARESREPFVALDGGSGVGGARLAPPAESSSGAVVYDEVRRAGVEFVCGLFGGTHVV